MTPGQNKSHEITFFNTRTKEKDYDRLNAYGYRSIIRAFENYLGKRSSQVKNAVDLGCGTGAFTRRFFNHREIKSFGIDIVFQAVERAKSQDSHNGYFVSDISQVGLKEECMDLVIFSGALHHFPDPTDCLKEAYRILKKGGVLLSYDPHLYNPVMWLYRHPHSIFYSKKGITDNERLVSKEQMNEVLQTCKFSGIKIQAISGVTFSTMESPAARFLLPIYNLWEYGLGLLPIAKTIGSFLICYAEKK